MGCSALLCGRFADSQESRFQVSKRSNMCSAVVKLVVLLIFTNSVFKLQNIKIWTVSNYKAVYLLIARNGIFIPRNVQIRAVPSCKSFDLLIFTNSGFRVRNGEKMCSALQQLD